MDPAAPTAPPDTSQTPLQTGKSGTSALGGSKAISDRLASFMDKRGGETKDKPTLPLPDKKKEPAQNGDGKDKVTDKADANGKDKIDPAKKEAPADGKDKIGTDGLTKEERAQVVEFKKRAEAAETRVKELETKASDGEATAKELAELKKLHKDKESDYERNEREIAAIRVQGSKKYQETIAKPMQMLTDKIEEIAKGCQLDPDAVFNTIGMGDLVKRNAALKEYMDAMDPLTQDTFKQAVNTLLDLEPKAKKIMAEAREVWQATQLEEKEAAKAADEKRRETYLKASDAVWDEMTSRIPALADPEIAKQVRAKADNFDIAKAEPDLQAFAAQSAYAIKHMQAAIDSRDVEIAQLKESVKRLGGERLGPGDGAPGKQEDTRKLEGATSGDRFRQWSTGRGR